MGYPHWRLGKGSDYQVGIARMLVAKMLDAHAKGIEGPLAMAHEAPIDGWDDIVEFGADNGQLIATHYQVKRQYTNFDFESDEKIGTFTELFTNAAEILSASDPYNHMDVNKINRTFRFVFPTDGISVGASLGIYPLRCLLEACVGNAADTIVANKGANLGEASKSTKKRAQPTVGDQKRAWLELIRAAAGNDDACANLLRQMRIDCYSESMVDDNKSLAALFDDPDRARDLIDKAIRSTSPEGWLDVEGLLPVLSAAKPKPELLQCRIVQHGSKFYEYSQRRSGDLPVVANTIVQRVWCDHGATRLHVAFPHPSRDTPRGALELRSACIRLLLHAQLSPVHVSGSYAWYESCRSKVQRTLGVQGRCPTMEEKHFAEHATPLTLPPKWSWPPDILATALHNAMNEHVWRSVSVEWEKLGEGLEMVPFDSLSEMLKKTPDLWDCILRGWWAQEADASGVARAGPGITYLLAMVVGGLAVLQYAGFDVLPSDGRQPNVARLGALSVRALAIDVAAVRNVGELRSTRLAHHARHVLEYAGVVLIAQGNSQQFYDWARQRPDSPGADVSLQSTRSPALLMDSDFLMQAAAWGPEAAKNDISDWCKRLTSHHVDDLEAALTQWNEANVAA